MLSGKSCCQIFDLDDKSVQDVLEQSARLLGLDPDLLAGGGTLMKGASVINDLCKDVQFVNFVSSKTKGQGEQGAAGYPPKIFLLKRAKIQFLRRSILMISGNPFLSRPPLFYC